MSPAKAKKAKKAQVPPSRRNIGRAKKAPAAVVKPRVPKPRHPWAAALAFYLQPNISSPTSDPKWPTLEMVAQHFNIPLGSVLYRSTHYAWVPQQLEAEERYWTERNDAVMRMFAQKYVQVRGAAFALAGKGLIDLQGKMNQPMDLPSLATAIRSGQAAFDLATDAAGLSVSKAPAVAPARPLLTTTELVVDERSFDAKGQLIGFKKTHSMSIYAEILAAREAVAARAVAPLQEVGPSDPPSFDVSAFEEPSTLPPHLSACHGYE